MSKNEPKVNKNRLIVTILIVIATSLITFLVTWYVLDKSTAEQNEVSDKLRVNMQQEIDRLLKIPNKN